MMDTGSRRMREKKIMKHFINHIINLFHNASDPKKDIYAFDLYPLQYVPIVTESNIHPAVNQIVCLQKRKGIFIAAYFLTVRSLYRYTLVSELLKRMDTGTHVGAKLSKICANCYSLNAELEI